MQSGSEYICPHCKKPIYDDEALRCLYCGKGLNRSFGFMGRMKYTTPKAIAVTVIIIMLLSFIILVVR